MTLAGTRLLVLGFGVIVALAIIAGFAVVGGPDSGRRIRQDDARLADLRTIAQALICHSEAAASPPAPASTAEISTACLAPDAVGLVDPDTVAAFSIVYDNPTHARVCGMFDQPPTGNRASGWPPFDAGTGCVAVTLARR